MEKNRYFGSYALNNTIRKVKEHYPECKVTFHEDEEKLVIIKFKPEDRKKYHLSEGVKTYTFLNGHLILSHNPMDPFKYDALDELIEKEEIKYDVMMERSSLEKIRRAVFSCEEFQKKANVSIGNQSESSMDVRLFLNGTERFYQVDLLDETVHLKKLEPCNLQNETVYSLSSLPSWLQFKILKTTHPGLLTSATEYISGMRDDKVSWSTPADAYAKPWRLPLYDKLGITALDVLLDIPDSRLVGKFSEVPMRHLILIDGSEYAYSEHPFTLMTYEQYESERDTILNGYKTGIMNVVRATGVSPKMAIEAMRIDGSGAGVVLCSPEQAIASIQMDKIKDPLNGIAQKLERQVKLNKITGGFSVSLRKPADSPVRHFLLNENGKNMKMDINSFTLEHPNPYTTMRGTVKQDIPDLTRFPMTQLFIQILDEELKKIAKSTEQKTYQFFMGLKGIGFTEREVKIEEQHRILMIFPFPNTNGSFQFFPYENALFIEGKENIEEDKQDRKRYEQAIELYQSVFGA